MAPTVRVLFFATARGAVGRSTLEREVPDAGIEIPELLDSLRHEFPRLDPVLKRARILRNGEYVPSGAGRLAPGDELAIHPPYSGG